MMGARYLIARLLLNGYICAITHQPLYRVSLIKLSTKISY